MRNQTLIFYYFLPTLAFALFTHHDAYAQPAAINRLESGDTIALADPTIFFDNGVYYLYGTGGNRGFQVYSSNDLQRWKGPVGLKDGYALVRGDSYGTSGFWAPQVFKRSGRYFMAYTANENIAIAYSNSPLGPFKQDSLKALSGNGKQIDPFVFFDKHGKIYLYHVRLQNGNRIFVAELKDDLSDIKAGTEKECIAATEPWENTRKVNWPVAEGPTVLKLGSRYYLFYSANDFRNIDYAMGYAVSEKPEGPWIKYAGNPLISRNNIGINGTGHGDFIQRKRNWYYVLHTHRNDKAVSPRLTAIIHFHFSGSKKRQYEFKADSTSFRYLMKF